MKKQDVKRRLQAFESLCRQRGLPVTVQRREILETVLQREDHPTADQVYDALSGRIPGLSRMTVYRVLSMLVEMGIIGRLHHPGTVARFDGREDRHHHLICGRCGKVIDIQDTRCDGLPLPNISNHEFEIEDFSVHFSGICSECRRV
ncbi:MAG: Fur family transcriptional regulator [Planctomycetota bacterium]